VAVTVLIIDDEEMIRTLTQKILSRAGFDVLTAESGQKGIQLYSERRGQVDMILLDLTMDDISGVEVLRKIREISGDLPCIISSGQPPGTHEIPDELQWNVYFLQKPYRANQLSDLVGQILSGVQKQT